MKRTRAICVMTVFAILGAIAPAAWFGGANSDALAYDISNCQQDTTARSISMRKDPHHSTPIIHERSGNSYEIAR